MPRSSLLLYGYLARGIVEFLEGLNKSWEEVWEVTRFNASLWVFVLWAFCRYLFGLIFLH